MNHHQTALLTTYLGDLISDPEGFEFKMEGCFPREDMEFLRAFAKTIMDQAKIEKEAKQLEWIRRYNLPEDNPISYFLADFIRLTMSEVLDRFARMDCEFRNQHELLKAMHARLTALEKTYNPSLSDPASPVPDF